MNKDRELVSVVIPTYNRVHPLIEAIDSVLGQSYDNIEIIVIDDGSTDNTFEKLVKYHDIIKYSAQKNSGPGAARNKGIKLSSGKYIAFLDSDDLWASNKIKTQVDFMENNLDYSLCCSDFREVCGTQILHKSVHDNMKIANGFIFDHLLKNQFVKTSTVLIRSEIIKKAGLFSEDLRAFEDRFLWFNIARTGKIYFLDENLVTARINNDNITSDLLLMYDNYIRFYSELLSQNGFSRAQKKLIRKSISDSHHNMAYSARNEGDLSLARFFYKKSFVSYPRLWIVLAYLKTYIVK